MILPSICHARTRSEIKSKCDTDMSKYKMESKQISFAKAFENSEPFLFLISKR